MTENSNSAMEQTIELRGNSRPHLGRMVREMRRLDHFKWITSLEVEDHKIILTVMCEDVSVNYYTLTARNSLIELETK